MSEFCTWIEKERSKKGLTRKAMAQLIGIDPAQYSGYASGKMAPRQKTIAKIASSLDRTEDEIRSMLSSSSSSATAVEVAGPQSPAETRETQCCVKHAPNNQLEARLDMIEARLDYIITILKIMEKQNL